MAFQKCPRSCKIGPGWRLATVDEVRRNLRSINPQDLPNESERARLLDGWIGGSSDDLQPRKGFRSCLGYMLLVQCPTPDISGSDDMVTDLYSDVNLDEEGMRAAFFLCCEDWNYEVVYWLLNRWYGDKTQIFRLTGNVESLTEMMLETSQAVSKVAMALHSMRPMKRVRRTDFTRNTMRSMVSGILESFHEKTKDTESLEKLYWLLLGYDLGGQCWDEMGLTLDLARFQDFDLNTNEHWDEIADIVWYVTADALAVVTVKEFVSQKRNELDQLASTSQITEDQVFLISIVACADQLLHKTFIGTDSLGKVVKKAATTAKGNCKRLKAIISEEGYGTFSYQGKNGVLNSVLVGAAKRGDMNLVKRLLEYGVRPLETDDVRKKTALHHAANLRNEDKALQIAKILLIQEKGASESLANAIDHKQRIPLHRAANHGHTKVCKLLLDYHSDICAKDTNGQNPLHYVFRHYQPKDEVINVLISGYRDKLSNIDADATEKGLRRVSLVDEKGNNGKTPLDLAVERQHDNVRMVAGLLLESDKPEAYFKKLDLAYYLRESSLHGYGTLVKKLLKSGADPLERDSEGRTSLHCAVEGQNEHRAQEIISYLLPNDGQLKKLELVAASGEQLKSLELLTASDNYGRSALHVAALVGHVDICFWLLSFENHRLKIDTRDRDDQSAIYYAVAGHHDNDEVLDVLFFAGGRRQGFTDGTENSSGTTPLHVAAERGNHNMVAKLLSGRVFFQAKDRQEYVRTADVLGQTALHKAASGGHVKVVSKLLQEGAHPLVERDCDGKTALHHAVQAENEEAAMEIVKLLLKKCEEKEKSLLLFASAVGIGYAEESLESKPKLKSLIAKQKREIAERTVNLVQLAAESGNIDMTRELLTRGANIGDILGEDWISDFSEDRKQNVLIVQKQIVNMIEKGTDKPTLLDNLGRNAFADGLAALFLNPFVKSPITVGISGEWGMGKSSLMIQTEAILLKTAAQLAFIDLLRIDDFPGSRKSISSGKCEVKNLKLRQSIQRMLASKGDMEIENFLSSYRAEYHAIFKSLAVMDHGDTFENDKQEESREKDFKSDGKMHVKIPSILTVRYNAWNYQSESEAWAGLAVEITKELESTMTVGQRLRTSWRYTWENRRRSICVDVILPCSFAIILAIWATVILWLVLDRVEGTNIKDIKYGSLPLTLIAVVWAIVKSVMSVVKPISSHMLDYMSLPDHSQKLGYHHKVSNDINFLKDAVGHKAFWLWNVFAFIWCCATFSLNDNYIPHTIIPKTTPPSKGNLKMIVFVDDLDRCQETVVLKILSAVNLVLAACEIDVVLGMDKSMMERAIIRMFGDKSNKPNKRSRDMADKYLRKIIQLPLDLPDPSDSESLSFLEEQLGVPATLKEALESAAGTQKQNVQPKFRMRTLTPQDSKTAGVDITDTGRESGLNPHGVPEEIDDSTDARSAGEGSTLAEEQQEEGPGESGDSQPETAIPMPSGDPINIRSDISCAKLLKKLISRFVHKQPENLESNKTLPRDENHSKLSPSKLSPISNELLLPKYSKGERDAFYFLRHQATTSRKLPREWKRLLNYHRLAWNILFKSKEVEAVAGWQVQLIAWVFVCWQWKDRVDTLIQEWDELNVLRNWVTINDDQRKREQNIGPSLKVIVEHYIEERWPTSISNEFSARENLPKASALEAATSPKTRTFNEISIRSSTSTLPKAVAAQEDDSTDIIESTNLPLTGEGKNTEERDMEEVEPSEEVVKGKGVVNGVEEEKAENSLRQDRQIKTNNEKKLSEIAEGKGKRKVNKEKDKEKDDELEEWKKLKQTLRRYNVSMEGIQVFQKFRFYCVPGHLHWPLQKSS